MQCIATIFESYFHTGPYLEVGEVLAEDEELVLARGLVELGLVDALVGVGVAVVGVLVEAGPGVVAHNLAPFDVDRQVALSGHPVIAVLGDEDVLLGTLEHDALWRVH